MPSFVEIDLVGHEGGNASGAYCFTLTVTDIATGWTINQSAGNKAQKWVFEALQHVVAAFRSRSCESTATTAASSSTTSFCAAVPSRT